MKLDEFRAWLSLAGFGLLLFLITAVTYSSLGVVLPAMVTELGWNWTQAGLGFTLVGVFTGASSFIPAYLIRKFGVRPTLLAGTAVMAAGLACAGLTHGVGLYWFGCALMGLGYQMMALIPGTHVLAAVFQRRATVFGIYFTFGSLGGVAGPWMVQASNWLFHGDWRAFWFAAAAVAVAVGALCTALTGDRAWLARRSVVTDAEVAAEASKPAGRIYRSAVDWTVKAAVRTPQYYVLLAAYFGHLLIGVTVASLAVAHMTELGVAATTAGAMLSVEALVQTAGRVVGGALGDRMDPKHILVFALGALVVGSGALSVAHSYPMMILYAVGVGLGFGLTSLVVTVLLLNYFGRRHNLEIFSLTCLVGAVSALGPVIGGAMRDRLGGFSPTFELFAGLIFVLFVAAAFMRPPRPSSAAAGSDLSAALAKDPA